MSLYQAVLAKLEFPAVLEMLADRCRFSLAAERAAKGGRLQPGDLLLVLDMVAAARSLRRSFLRLPEAEARFPELTRFVDSLAELPDIETDINRSIGPRGDVLDTASPALSQIRRAVRVAQSRLMERLQALVSGGKYASALQDAIVTTRDGRYVVPVRAEARNAVPGVVHDTSASGQTVFVEPFDVVELNNKWRERQIEEQHEVDRVLDGLSARVGARVEQLDRTVEATAAIDLAMAKARLAFDQEANRPILWDADAAPDNLNADGHASHRIKLVKARHPLLDADSVVPTDLEIGPDFRVLVITGPNTGGKTVALKTVGLLTLMAQTGFFIPAEESSVVSVFPALFADIGDEQSIAQSLSTFSAHMRTVVGMLGHVTADSLVLLDELGAGTDPQEGSALARSLVTELLERGALVIATTHYSEVKAFAYATPGVENASVEFDVRTLAPTYKLMVGVPGRSNALAIARRLGMPGRVLDRAAGLIDPDEVRADALLQDIRRRRDEADAILAKARETESAAQQLRRIAVKELREAERQRQDARTEALAEAEAELAQVRETLKILQRDRGTVTLTRQHVENRRQEAELAAETVRSFRRQRVFRPAPTQDRKPIAAGDRVRISALGQEADVESVSDGTADLRLGTLKMRQPLAALERLGRSRPAAQPERTVYQRAAPDPVDIELDLRGYRATEVEPMLERYLDNAHRSGLPFVRIIHGKGTGALRNVVREYLAAHPAVGRHELAGHGEGGDGATVAYLRES